MRNKQSQLATQHYYYYFAWHETQKRGRIIWPLSVTTENEMFHK